MLHNIVHHLVQERPRMVARTFVMHIAERPLNGVSTWAIGGQPQQRKAGMMSQPLRDGFGFMNAIVVHNNGDARDLRGRIGLIEEAQKIPKERVGFAESQAREDVARGKVQGTCEILFGVRAWRHDFALAPFGHPSRADLGQQMDVQFIGKDQYLIRGSLFDMPPNLGQALDALGVIIFRHDLGAFPDPAHGMEPSADRPSGDRQPILRLEFHGECGTAPACATPAIDMGQRGEQSQQTLLHPRAQRQRPYRGGQLPPGIDSEVEVPSR